MNSIQFQVSAKMARLIGRENISDVNGAILELVKNGYDADADCVYVKYINPFDSIPNELTLEEITKYFDKSVETIGKYYYVNDGKYVIKENLSEKENLELRRIILELSKIIVIDNGCGMTQKILETTWMNIGTDDKELNITSKKKHRIKTGAKGIGRFALDKLSLKSQVITKNAEDNIVRWNIDWTQFDNAKFLNQVKANIETVDGEFSSIVKNIIGSGFKKISSYNWSTGTIIILTPIRDFWNEKLYEKVNNSLKNINPLEKVDKFDVVVSNDLYPSLSYTSKNQSIDRELYDYMIEAKFDGDNKVKIIFDRNELNISLSKIEVAYSDNDRETYNLDDFWENEIFKKEKYRREDFNGKVNFEYALKELIKKKSDEQLKLYSKIGPFSLNIYYLKNSKSTIGIVRDFKIKERKKLLYNFSGIKIYRDEFKVRPYGDDGGMFYDWLNLAERVQRSPAAASHETGSWRVSPNQILGSVSISRITNPNLEDTANREGMNINQEYSLFIELIQSVFEKFEFDRQYPLREYATWYNGITKTHDDKVQKIYEQVMKEQKDKDKKDWEDTSKDYNNEQTSDDFSKDDLKDVIYSIGKKKDKEINTNQLLMVLSAAGVMAQTFSHEISRVATNLGSRGQHIKESINRILNHQPYKGDEDFNPYVMLDELNSTDLLLSEWVNLIMDSVDKEKFYLKEIAISSFLTHIKEKWTPLLGKKFIEIREIDCSKDIVMSFPEVDLHLLLNNFILNSAYFLEECEGKRFIDFKVYIENGYLIMDMKNNGPKLDEKYVQNPDEVLDAGESTKSGGSGLGLWVARQAVERNYGKLHVISVDHGFLLRATWKI